MIPRDFIHNCMFMYLYKFYTGKILLYILIFYISIVLYYQINDYSIIGMFFMVFLILLTQPFFINDSLKKEFKRYKKYQVLKRIRKYKLKKEKSND